MTNPDFEEELADWRIRRHASQQQLTMDLSTYISVHGSLPAGNLPARPAPP